MDYSNIDTLLHALDTEDCVTVKKCIEAGQSLDQIVRSGRTILSDAAWNRKYATIRTLCAFKKFCNLNCVYPEGTPALFLAISLQDIRTVHLLIQSGVDVNHRNNVGVFALRFGVKWEIRAMLLFVGADPRNATMPPPLTKTVQMWLSGLEMAKVLLKDIFDNPTLENVICEFVFIEEYLKKVV